jgi:hypothetical protein
MDQLEFLEAVNYYEEAAGLGAQFRDEVSAGVVKFYDLFARRSTS